MPAEIIWNEENYSFGGRELSLLDITPQTYFDAEEWQITRDFKLSKISKEKLSSLTQEETVNTLYSLLHKFPGDYALKFIGETLGIDYENKDVAIALLRTMYEVKVKV